MTTTRTLFTLFAAISSAAFAQLAPPNPQGVAMGHVHLTASDLDVHKKFWADMLGATPYDRNGLTGYSAPGVVILIRKGKPSAGSAGSSVNHFGFTAPELAPFLAKWDAAGYKYTRGTSSVVNSIVDGPDGIRVEITEDKSQKIPLKFHHIHFNSPDTKEIQKWYGDRFGAIAGTRQQWDAGDVPGVNLTYAKLDKPEPTAGRALDHIGFEVNGLEAFCKKLADAGVKFDTPYRVMPQLKLSLAFLTDPWGTRIELTEGLR